MANLSTTNLLLGIMAAVSVLEALVLIGIGIGACMAYRRVTDLMLGLEQRHVGPLIARVGELMGRVDDILTDVRAVSATVKTETERVDHAINRTIDRVDGTAHRLQDSVRVRTSRVVGFMRGLVTAIDHFTRVYQRAPGR
jgi:hypothetical protein